MPRLFNAVDTWAATIIAGQLPGASIASASLNLHFNSSAFSPGPDFSLYRLNEDWGEGTSSRIGQGAAATSGDATWNDSKFGLTSWTTPGGSFAATPSATTTVGNVSAYCTWSSAQPTTDVKNWLTSPATNFGWILRGDETMAGTARVFDSREGAANVRPQLQISYNPVLPPLTHRETWLRQYLPTPGTYVDDMADRDGDGIANGFEYAFAFSPLAANPSDADLVTWNTVTESAAGLTSTGPAFVSEADAPGESPIKIVTAVENWPASANRFSRLKIIRLVQ